MPSPQKTPTSGPKRAIYSLFENFRIVRMDALRYSTQGVPVLKFGCSVGYNTARKGEPAQWESVYANVTLFNDTALRFNPQGFVVGDILSFVATQSYSRRMGRDTSVSNVVLELIISDDNPLQPVLGDGTSPWTLVQKGSRSPEVVAPAKPAPVARATPPAAPPAPIGAAPARRRAEGLVRRVKVSDGEPLPEEPPPDDAFTDWI